MPLQDVILSGSSRRSPAKPEALQRAVEGSVKPEAAKRRQRLAWGVSPRYTDKKRNQPPEGATEMSRLSPRS